jgi:hypothetical protein
VEKIQPETNTFSRNSCDIAEGRELAAMNEQQDYIITPMEEPGEFSVWKEDSPNPPYVVRLPTKQNRLKHSRCECADWIYRRRYSHSDCKHILMCKERL